jgi:hypothetical protein
MGRKKKKTTSRSEPPVPDGNGGALDAARAAAQEYIKEGQRQRQRKDLQEREAAARQEKQRLMKTRSGRRKERVRLEREFLSAVMASIGTGDLRREVARYPGVSWRHFADTRHQALWRALQTLDLSKTTEERVDALMEERGLAPEGLAGRPDLLAELYKEAEDKAWLEREIDTGDLAPLVGGAGYLRAAIDAYPVSFAAGELARMLGFERKELAG